MHVSCRIRGPMAGPSSCVPIPWSALLKQGHRIINSMHELI